MTYELYIVALVRTAAEAGHPGSQSTLAMMAPEGVGVPQDARDAYRWFKSAADKGDSYAAYNLAILYRDGRFLGSSGLLGPDLTEVLALGRVSKGSHILRISAFGREGGCNRGALNGWGVDLVMSNNPANKALALEPSRSVRASRQAMAAPAAQPDAAEPPAPLFSRLRVPHGSTPFRPSAPSTGGMILG